MSNLPQRLAHCDVEQLLRAPIHSQVRRLLRQIVPTEYRQQYCRQPFVDNTALRPPPEQRLVKFVYHRIDRPTSWRRYRSLRAPHRSQSLIEITPVGVGPVLPGVVQVGARIRAPLPELASRGPHLYRTALILAVAQAPARPTSVQPSEHPPRLTVFEKPFHRHGGRRRTGGGAPIPPIRRRSPQKPHASPRGSKLNVDKIIWAHRTRHSNRAHGTTCDTR
jgi:hypothetical protein